MTNEPIREPVRFRRRGADSENGGSSHGSSSAAKGAPCGHSGDGPSRLHSSMTSVGNTSIAASEAVAGDRVRTPCVAPNGSFSAVIQNTVTADVIPQLYQRFGPGMIARKRRPRSMISPAMKSYLNQSNPSSGMPVKAFHNAEDLNTLLAFLIAQDEAGVLGVIERVADRGASFVQIWQGILAEAASMLNCGWQDDSMSFVEVSLATATISQVMKRFSHETLPFSNRHTAGKAAFVTAVIGDGHTLGAEAFQEMLRREGWAVTAGDNRNAQSLPVDIRKQWFTLVGISVSESTSIERCKRMVDDIRTYSKNPDVIIMVGGRAVIEHPGEAEFIDADIVARNAQHALSVVARIENVMDWSSYSGGGHVRLNHKWMSASHDHSPRGFESR